MPQSDLLSFVGVLASLRFVGPKAGHLLGLAVPSFLQPMKEPRFLLAYLVL